MPGRTPVPDDAAVPDRALVPDQAPVSDRSPVPDQTPVPEERGCPVSGFRLATVERLRGRRLAEAAGAFGRAQRDHAELTAARDDLADRLATCVPGSHATPGHVRVVAERRTFLRERIVAADELVVQAAARLDQAREGWLSARTGLRAVEALHERFRETVRAEQARRDQRLTDDLASLRRAPAGGDPA